MTIVSVGCRRTGPKPEIAALVFCTADEPMDGTAHWPLARLALIWNKLPGRKPVARFENRRIAVDRLWRAFQHTGEQLPGKAAHSRKQSTAARQNRAEAHHRHAARAERCNTA